MNLFLNVFLLCMWKFTVSWAIWINFFSWWWMFWHTQELYQGVQADRSSQQGLPSWTIPPNRRRRDPIPISAPCMYRTNSLMAYIEIFLNLITWPVSASGLKTGLLRAKAALWLPNMPRTRPRSQSRRQMKPLTPGPSHLWPPYLSELKNGWGYYCFWCWCLETCWR